MFSTLSFYWNSPIRSADLRLMAQMNITGLINTRCKLLIVFPRQNAEISNDVYDNRNVRSSQKKFGNFELRNITQIDKFFFFRLNPPSIFVSAIWKLESLKSQLMDVREPFKKSFDSVQQRNERKIAYEEAMINIIFQILPDKIRNRESRYLTGKVNYQKRDTFSCFQLLRVSCECMRRRGEESHI